MEKKVNALLGEVLEQFTSATFKTEGDKTFVTGVQFENDSVQFGQEVEASSDLKALVNGITTQITNWLKELAGKAISQGGIEDLEATPQQIVELFYHLEFSSDLEKCKFQRSIFYWKFYFNF